MTPSAVTLFRMALLVAPNKLVAKIASDQNKPDGLTVVRPQQVADFLAPLPVRRIHGVGPASERKLGEMGITTVAEPVTEYGD